MPVRITKPITLDQIATAAGLPTDESMSAVAGSLVGSLIAGVYPPASTRANHSMSEYVYSWTETENQRVVPSGSEFLISCHGYRVVISGDGNTMAEISQYDNYRVGAIRIWVWNGSSWVQQARLLPPYTIDQFADYSLVGQTDLGRCFSISNDGNTLMVSADTTPTSDMLLMYTRSGTTWTLSQQLLLSPGSINDRNIAMTRDSQLIFVGGDPNVVYARSGNTWSQLSTFSATGSNGYDPMSLSSNGQYVALYQNSGNSYGDRIVIYSRSGNTWNLHSTLIPVGDYFQRGEFCLNDTGTVLVTKAGYGSLLFFTRSGTTWTQVQSVEYGAVRGIVMNSAGTVVAISGSGGVSAALTSIWRSSTLTSWTNSQNITISNLSENMQSIGISTDGNRLAMGVPFTLGDRLGKVNMYHYNGSSFVQQGSSLVGTGDVTAETGFGQSISMTADGSRMFGVERGTSKVLIYDRNGSGQWDRSAETLGPPSDLIGDYWPRTIDVSADGLTVAVGESSDNSDIGAVWIYMKDNLGVWSSQKIIGTGYSGTPRFGHSLSISADGTKLVVGGPNDNSGIGAFWIFTRSGNTWTQLGSKRLPSDCATNPGAGVTGYTNNYIGYSVSISSDGNTIAVGAPRNSIDTGYTVVSGGETLRIFRPIGATWVYTRSGTTWTQQGSRLIGTGYYNPEGFNYDGNILQGWSVSLSADGNTLAVGAIGDGENIDGWFLNNERQGAVWVFTRSGTTWSQQGSKLAISGAVLNLGLGNAVSLSASGNVLAAGASIYDVDWFLNPVGEGAAAVFTRENGVWTNQTGILRPPNLSTKHWLGGHQAGFGTSVKVSASGRSIIFGGPGLAGDRKSVV